LKHIRSIPSLRHVPIIFMTAKSQPHEVRHFKSMGAIDVIVKPFDPMTLGDSLRNRWQHLQ
jgi:two-component system OmpR family response regulator